MIRQNLQPDSSYYAVFVEPQQDGTMRISVEVRDTEGIISRQIASTNGAITTPVSLKIVTVGTTISAYMSQDGMKWGLINGSVLTMDPTHDAPGQTLTLDTSTALVGIAISSHDANTLVSAILDEVALDACPKPEQGHYWFRQYGEHWTWSAPNSASRDYNAFIRDTTDVANAAFQQRGIEGVITTIRSTNTFFASHPDVFEQATAEKLGRMTIDSYPEQSTTDPLTAANARVEELKTIENIWHLPMIIGEMGYSNQVEVDNVTQQNVLKAEFQAIEPLSYVAGVNYWVGPSSNTSGGYTHIFAKSGQGWFLRPAANELSLFYKRKLSTSG